MPNLGTTELLIILGIVVLVFGVGKLPQLGRGLGQSIREFRTSVQGSEEKQKETQTEVKEEPSS